jgi:hypothetical protein
MTDGNQEAVKILKLLPLENMHAKVYFDACAAIKLTKLPNNICGHLPVLVPWTMSFSKSTLLYTLNTTGPSILSASINSEESLNLQITSSQCKVIP